MSVVDYLQLYRQMGLCVIPAHRFSKRPVLEWSDFQERQPTEAEYQEWIQKYWNRQDPFNIGVVCGKVSGDFVKTSSGSREWYSLVVLDFDSIDAYHKFFPKHYELEEQTMTVKTSKGVHVYFRAPNPFLSFKIPQLKLEARSEGNFCILPPSTHPSGIQYILNPLVWLKRQILPIKDLYEGIWRRAEELGVKRPEDRLGRLREKLGGKPYRSPDPPCIQVLLKGVDEGFRNEAGMRLSSYWLNFRKLKVETVRQRLLEWNSRNNPPMSEKEVLSCLNNVIKYGCAYGCPSMQVFCDAKKCKIGQIRIEKKMKHRVSVEEFV